MAHVADTCDHCGQTDDHPKHRYAHPGGVDTHHFDCIPHTVMADLTSVTDHQFDPDQQRFRVAARTPIPTNELDEHAAFILKVRDKAGSGVHGDELRAWIVKNGPKAQEG
jgi:hypothetical protein